MVKRGRKSAKRATTPRRTRAIPKAKSSTARASKPGSLASKASKPKSGRSKSRMARLESELRIARDRQTATSDILRVISQSPTDVQPVFDAIVLSAVRLLGCDSAFILLCNATTVWPVAEAGPEGPRQIGVGPAPIDPDATFPSRAIITRKNLHVPDWPTIELPE